MRYFTTPSVRDARKSVGWSLLFIFLLYFTAPAYAVFAKAEVYQNVLGADVSSAAAIQSLFDQAGWLLNYGKLGLVKMCGYTMDATAQTAAIADAVFQACQAKGTAVLNFPNLTIDNDVIVIATPEIAGLPYVISGLVAAGGLAAALSTADGLLLAIANALSHDIYYRMIDQHASTARRLTIARILLVGVAARRGRGGDLQAIGHPLDGGLGVQPGGGGIVHALDARRLVEANHQCRRDRGHDHRLWRLPLLPGRNALLPGHLHLHVAAG